MQNNKNIKKEEVHGIQTNDQDSLQTCNLMRRQGVPRSLPIEN